MSDARPERGDDADDDRPCLRLGDLSDLGDGRLRVVHDDDGRALVVCRVAGRLHAVEDTCSHRDTPLSEGRLRGAVITCPLHGATFDVRDGSHLSPPAIEGIASFEVTEDDDGAVVHLAPHHPVPRSET